MAIQQLHADTDHILIRFDKKLSTKQDKSTYTDPESYEVYQIDEEGNWREFTLSEFEYQPQATPKPFVRFVYEPETREGEELVLVIHPLDGEQKLVIDHESYAELHLQPISERQPPDAGEEEEEGEENPTPEEPLPGDGQPLDSDIAIEILVKSLVGPQVYAALAGQYADVSPEALVQYAIDQLETAADALEYFSGEYVWQEDWQVSRRRVTDQLFELPFANGGKSLQIYARQQAEPWAAPWRRLRAIAVSVLSDTQDEARTFTLLQETGGDHDLRNLISEVSEIQNHELAPNLLKLQEMIESIQELQTGKVGGPPGDADWGKASKATNDATSALDALHAKFAQVLGHSVGKKTPQPVPPPASSPAKPPEMVEAARGRTRKVS